MEKETYWYVLRTKPHKELVVKSILENRGYQVYLPMILAKNGHVAQAILKPLITNYIFVYTDSLNLGHLHFVPGTLGPLQTNGQPARLPERAIETLRIVCGQQDASPNISAYIPGTRIRIINGPLAGREGILCAPTDGKGGNKNQVLLDIGLPEIYIRLDVAKNFTEIVG